MVKGAAEAGLLTDLANLLARVAGDSVLGISLLLLWIGGIASSLVDNIPITVAFLPVIEEFPKVSSNFGMNGLPHESLWRSIILGANLGGGFTPIGSPSNIIALNMYYRITKDSEKRYDFFKTFLRVGIMLSTTLMGLATILIFLNLYLSVAIVSMITTQLG